MIEKQEFIGKKVEILYNQRVFVGTIQDETKNMLYLKTKERIIKIIKKSAMIKVEGKIIEGKKIAKRPEERIKAC